MTQNVTEQLLQCVTGHFRLCGSVVIVAEVVLALAAKGVKTNTINNGTATGSFCPPGYLASVLVHGYKHGVMDISIQHKISVELDT